MPDFRSDDRAAASLDHVQLGEPRTSPKDAEKIVSAVGVGTDCHFSRAYENSKLRNRLEVIESIRGDLESEAIEVPGVIVVGNQSAGKSSVLEAISGINFPRGENTCTRCASIVRLECLGEGEEETRPYALLSCNDPEQKTAQRVHDFQNIGIQIDQLTKSLGEGKDSGTILGDDVIYITVRNRSGPTMTLIDLPGLTFVHKTQKNIHDVTVDLIKKYIKNEQAVILAVIPATEDFGNCEALNLASEVDPEGSRTLGVATKCDMVGNDSDLCLKLRMERPSDIKLKLGFVGVRCRGPAEVKANMPFSEMAKKERELFTTHPIFTKGGSQKLTEEYWGMKTLVEKICSIQESTVERWLPKVKLQISHMIMAKEKLMENYPLACPDFSAKRKRLQEIIFEVDRKWYDLSNALAFREDDPSMNISARVRGIFARMRNSVRKGVPKFLDAQAQKEISKLLKECKAHGLPNFISDSVFSHMSRHQILPHLQQNAKHLIQEVSNYMTIVVGVLANESTKEYPKLAAEFELIASTVIQKQTEKAREHILELCDAEHLVYVSEEERYLEILNEISGTVNMTGPAAGPTIVKTVAPLLMQNKQLTLGEPGGSSSSSSGPRGSPLGTSSSSTKDGGMMQTGRGVQMVSSSSTVSSNAPIVLSGDGGCSPHEIQQLVTREGRNLLKYGITADHLIRLATSSSEQMLNNSFLEHDQGAASGPLKYSGISAKDYNQEKVKETQVSLLAYSHIIQGRFIDASCMLCYKFLVKDLQQKVQAAFHELSTDQDRLEIAMAADPECVAKRKVLEESLQRLNLSMKRLSKCD